MSDDPCYSILIPTYKAYRPISRIFHFENGDRWWEKVAVKSTAPDAEGLLVIEAYPDRWPEEMKADERRIYINSYPCSSFENALIHIERSAPSFKLIWEKLRWPIAAHLPCWDEIVDGETRKYLEKVEKEKARRVYSFSLVDILDIE